MKEKKKLNILIICTYFPPDSTIAAVRPFMFAKYLTKAGHKVTVLRSGEFYSPPDNSYHLEEQSFRVITYLGEDAPAEKYKQGLYVSQNDTPLKKGKKIPRRFVTAGKTVLNPILTARKISSYKEKFEKMKSEF